jgi:hypothetical protein
MVVMVVFVILYLVVFQLHYTTKLEERLSKARAASAQGSAAIQSVSYYILTAIAEDYTNSAAKSSSTTPTTTSTTGIGKITGGAGGASTGEKNDALQSSPGTEPGSVLAGSGAGGAGGPVDHLGKAILSPDGNSQSINGVSVSYVIECNEGKFDLNQLWNYAPSQAETIEDKAKEGAGAATAGTGGAGDKDVAGLLDKADPTGQASKALAKDKAASRKSRTGADGKGTGNAADQAAENTMSEAEEEITIAEFEPPTEERRLETRQMLAWAIDAMYAWNTTYGFDYKSLAPNSQMLADEIEAYAFERRSQPYANYIHLTSELLNLLPRFDASPEVFYGPMPKFPEGEEYYYEPNGEYRYKKNKFGKLEGEYIYDEDLQADDSMWREQIAGLRESYGLRQFETLPGFGSLGNPLTQNMKKCAEVEDEYGNIQQKRPPLPIGLQDLFCTYSSGKININTAPFPVLYALLPLIITTEPGDVSSGRLHSKAEKIAMDIWRYRQSYQPVAEENGGAGVPSTTSSTSGAASVGAPTRKAPRDAQGNPIIGGRNGRAQAAADLLSSSGASGMAGLTQEELSQLEGGTGADEETNYFTNLEQLKLIDGEDEGPEDYLSDKNAGVQMVSSEDRTPLQKVRHDYEQVMAFGGTYFTATLWSEIQDSPSFKKGYLTILRDVKKKRMEVIQWKEVER